MKKNILAYVDGSADIKRKKVGGGVVLFTSNYELHKMHVRVPDKFIIFNNVAGELYATMAAISYAIKNNYTGIKIYYDYYGIEKWAKNEWKAKNELTKFYVDFYQKSIKKINVKFEKVKAHLKKSERTYKNEMNELADKVAKETLEL